jgi:branched-chain amino acid transport system substrate-binding protein
MRHHRVVSVLSACALLALTTACGSDGNASSATPAATTPVATIAAPTTAASTASSESSATDAPSTSSAAASGPATGEPIKLLNISTLESAVFSAPQVQSAIEAREKSINDAGGVAGRPIQVEFCNDKFDPNEASACARKAVDEKVVAVVGSLNLFAANIFPILSDAGIPWIGGAGSSGAIELTDPISYPIHGGTPSMIMGAGAALVTKKGAHTVSIVGDDNPGSASGVDLFKQGVSLAGGESKTFIAPAGTVDYSALVGQAMEGNPDAVAVATVPANAAKFIKTLRDAGYKGVVGGVSSAFPKAAIDALGADANGILIGFRMIPPTNTDNPTVAKFLADMAAHAPDAQIDELALDAWTATGFFADVASRLDKINSASVRAYLDDPALKPIDLGVLPAYGSRKAPEKYPRARNFVTILAEINDGKVNQLGDFYDPLGSGS